MGLQQSNLKSADFLFFENNIEASDEKDLFLEIMSEYFLGKTEPKRKNNFWCICGIISAAFFVAIIIYLVVNMFLLSPKEIGDIEEIGNFSIRVDVNDENNECIEQFEDFVTSKRWHLDSQKNAKEYYTSTKLPQLKVLMLTTLSPAMSFEVNDEQVTISIHSIIRFDQKHPFNGTSISSNPVLNGEEEASIKRHGCGWVSTYKSLLEPPKDMPPLIQTAKWTLNNETLIVSRTNNWSNINGIWKFV